MSALGGIVTAILAVPCLIGAVALAVNEGDTAKASQWLQLRGSQPKKKTKKDKEKEKKKKKKEKTDAPVPQPEPEPEPEPEYYPRNTELYGRVERKYEQAHAPATPPESPRVVGTSSRSSNPADMSERAWSGSARSPAQSPA